jgi:transposase
LDVHKETVVCCARLQRGGEVERQVRTFKTTTNELLALSAWLSEMGCTSVAMEATGVYWRPVWHVLGDGEFELVLANAAHVKAVPGRKTDVNDATWLADLMAHGLIRGSFVPDAQTQQLRTLLRTRKQLVRERSGHIQRLQKTLEDANIKLESMISDILGVSGRAMVEAIIAGETDLNVLVSFADPRLKASPQDLREALRGRVTSHHRFMLQLHLDQVDALNRAISRIDEEVKADADSFRAAVKLLKTIPGLGELGAQTLLSEIGLDMSRFPSVAQLISWACLCPRSDQSAGKKRSTRMRKGAPWLKATLIQCAWAAIRVKASRLQALYHRLRARRGAKKAIGAVAAAILRSAYHMLQRNTPYREIGVSPLNPNDKWATARRLIKRLNALGYAAQLSPIPAVSS